MNVYLIISDSIRSVEKELKKIIDYQNETISFDFLFNSIEEILMEASYNSLFNDKKNILVYNADFFSNNTIPEKETLLIENYLHNENSLTTICFISKEKGNSKNKLYKMINDNGNVRILSKEKKDLNKEITDYCLENKYSISKDAINYIKSNAQNNLDLIFNELDKLFLYYSKPQEITLNVVKETCSTNIEDNNFKLIDAIISKRYNECTKLLNDLKIMKIEPMILFSLIIREFRLLYLYKVINDSNNSFEEYLKNYNLRDWQFEKIERNASNYSLKDLKKIIVKLGEYDILYKSGSIDRSNFLDILLLEIFGI